MEDLSGLKVADLKKELKLRNLPTSGSKPELVQRLQDALNSDKPASDDSAMDDALLDEDSVLGEDDDESVGSSDNENNTSNQVDSTSVLLSSPEKKVLLSPTKKQVVTSVQAAAIIPAKTSSVPGTTIKSTSSPDKKQNGASTKEAADGETVVKKAKITINREPVQPPVIAKVAAPTSPTKLAVGAASTTTKASVVNSVVKPPAEGTAIKLTPALSLDERAKLRQQKFGSVTADTTKAPATNVTGKLKQRAERFGGSLSTTSTTAASGKVALTTEEEARLAKRRERFGAQLNETKPSATVAADTKQKRAERFGSGTASQDVDEKKKTRAARFGVST